MIEEKLKEINSKFGNLLKSLEKSNSKDKKRKYFTVEESKSFYDSMHEVYSRI